MSEAAMKPYQDQTYYELLEVPVTASNDEILSAYERASELYAPDSVAIYALENPAHADELRARLREAMEILTEPDLRVEYDRSLGLAPRRPRSALETGRAEEKPADPLPLAAVEVLASSEAIHSTHPEFAVSYVLPPDDDDLKAEPPPPRVEPDMAPVMEAFSPIPATESEPTPRPVAPEPAPRPVAPEPAPRAAAPGPAPRAAAPGPAPRAAEPRPPDPRASRPPTRNLEVASQLSEESAIATAEAALAQVAAKIRGGEGRPRPLDVPADAEFNGELLRRIRESRGLTLNQVADRTRISARHLENVEADRYAALPAAVYLRGILMNLAREYGLDALRVSKSYLNLAGKKG